MPPTPPPPSSAEVAESIRAALASGTFAPGTRLVEEKLAAIYGVSRIPVREALLALVAEGLLERQSRGGVIVPNLSISDLEQIYLARRALESILYQAAADHLTDDDIDFLVEKHIIIRGAADSSDIRSLAEHNRAFHFRIMSAADLPRILAMVEHMWDITGSYRSFYWLDSKHRTITVRDHTKIIDACRRRDGDALVGLHDQHRKELTAQRWPWIDASLGDLGSSPTQSPVSA